MGRSVQHFPSTGGFRLFLDPPFLLHDVVRHPVTRSTSISDFGLRSPSVSTAGGGVTVFNGFIYFCVQTVLPSGSPPGRRTAIRGKKKEDKFSRKKTRGCRPQGDLPRILGENPVMRLATRILSKSCQFKARTWSGFAGPCQSPQIVSPRCLRAFS